MSSDPINFDDEGRATEASDFSKAALRARRQAVPMSDIRFDFIAAVLAWKCSRNLNGPFHSTTREFASRLEFAQAELFYARHPSARQA